MEGTGRTRRTVAQLLTLVVTVFKKSFVMPLVNMIIMIVIIMMIRRRNGNKTL